MTRREAALAVLFTALLAVMAAHEAEHVAQLVQKNAMDASCPADCRGVLGFVFDLEWVHFAYNTGIEAALVALLVGFGLWRSPLLVAGVALQGYHVFEHVEKLQQWLDNGHHSPTPGLLGMHFSLVELHFVFNTTVFLLVLGGYLHFRLHRRLWAVRTPRRAAAVAALAAFSVVGTAAAWTQRPPTIHLAAGVHQGPIVLDRPARLVGESGAVVRGGIVVTSDYVVVRDVRVEGGENAITVENATNVVLDGVEIAGAEVDGVHVRRASVTIRDCRIGAFGSAWSQGIDISFAFDLPASLVEGCRVSGAREGIVSHFSRVRLRDNRVRDTALRAITVTEMSMGVVEENRITSALGVGIFCGDYSVCRIERNRVVGTLADPESDDASRAGYAIQAHFGAKATLRDNSVSASAGGVAAFADAHVEHD